MAQPALPQLPQVNDMHTRAERVRLVLIVAKGEMMERKLYTAEEVAEHKRAKVLIAEWREEIRQCPNLVRRILKSVAKKFKAESAAIREKARIYIRPMQPSEYVGGPDYFRWPSALDYRRPERFSRSIERSRRDGSR